MIIRVLVVMSWSFCLSQLLSLTLALSGTSNNSNSNNPPKWLTDRLLKFDLVVHDFPITGRGLRTTRDRSTGDVLIKVPQSEAVTVASILQRYPVLEQAVEQRVAVSLMQEEAGNDNNRKLLLSDEQVLATGLLLLRHDQDPYALSLPSFQYSVLQMPPSYETFLPWAYQKLIRAYRQHCLSLREDMIQAVETLRILLQKDDSDINGQSTNREDVQIILRLLVANDNDFLWAFATVRSRCVGMDAQDNESNENNNNSNNYRSHNADDRRIRTGGVGEIRVMLPGFDLLNHKFGAQTTPGIVYGDNSKDSNTEITSSSCHYNIQSNDVYKKDDQVFISYSDHRDNLKMLMTYGFCIPGNPQQVVTFDAQDLLQACAAARPQYFTRSVLGQLWSLMEKLGKQRDMYVWDGRIREPHETLRTALNMMVELEKQFLVPSEDGVDNDQSITDDTFGADLLRALLMNRRKELLKCQSLLNDHVNDGIDPAWLSMKSSIQLLLEEEISYLAETNQADEGECGVEENAAVLCDARVS